MIAWLEEAWPYLTALVIGAFMLGTAAHAVIHKRDHRAALGWTGIIVAVPGLGALLYVIFGVNRVHRKAVALYRGHRRLEPPPSVAALTAGSVSAHGHLTALSQLINRVAERPLLGGNVITPLVNGEETYPAMLAAIRSATQSLTLSTYIFDRDEAGQLFVDALADAVRRGVDTRVLVDAVGARYSFPSILRRLKQARVPVARFNRTFLPWTWRLANLRNHRKILVADGTVAFTGGLNIRQGHLVKSDTRHPVTDLHFRVEGPVVREIQGIFAEDWFFTTEERLGDERFFPDVDPVGNVPARCVVDGPDDDLDKLRWAILGAMSCARRRIRIQTPYFLPENDMLATMRLAALRGVEVELLLPGKNNQALVSWASDAALTQLLPSGIKAWKVPAPFDHTKVMVVDDTWVLFGSANLDPRSLRLNFELNVECYSLELATEINHLLDGKRAIAVPITAQTLAERGLLRRLRDGVARLMTPYL